MRIENCSDDRYLIHSFDVFDTCITRRYARPADLFYRLGMQLADRHASTSKRYDFAAAFVEARIHAEHIANRHPAFRESATIQEIYVHFQLPGLRNINPKELADAEIALELDCLYPVAAARRLINSARMAGRKVVFISDMYLPASILRPVLSEFDLLRDHDRLYVSCDARVTKASGKLFRHVLQQESIEPHQLLHIGDNPHGDVEVPRGLGIAVNQFTEATLNRHEAAISGRGRRLSIGPQQSLIAALSRETRLQLSEPEMTSPALDRILYGTIAPFLIAYVAWVLNQARSKGIRRLYFVARDGEIMREIAMRLARPDDKIELRYLYGSRKAWIPASLTTDSDAWSRALTPQGQINSMDNILRRAGLSATDRGDICRLLELGSRDTGRNLNALECAEFIQSIKSNQRAHELLTAASSRERELVLRYLEQEGLCDPVPWALVDTGWALNCQAALKRILSPRLGAGFQPMGYYIALTRNRLSEVEAGTAVSFVPNPELVFCRRRTLVEHCLTPALHTSTQGYQSMDNLVKPVLGNEVRGEFEMAYVRRLHEICTREAELVGRNPVLLEQLSLAASQTVELVEKFILDPSKEDAQAMQSFSANADFFHETGSVQPFCRPFRFRDLLQIIRMTLSEKSRLKRQPFIWLEGCCALSPIYIRLPMSILLRIKLVSMQMRFGSTVA